MAHILAFQARASGSSRLQSRGDGRKGEVVIFPGVRYERALDLSEPSARSSDRQRDKIELES